jgi:K(+)-stimulated pyrophosphate-energized sodium pump
MGFGSVDLRPAQEHAGAQVMLDISELIYATCKSYMIQQGKFLMILWAFIARGGRLYFGSDPTLDGRARSMGDGMPMSKVAIILAFSLIGIAGPTASRGSASA